MEAEALTTQDLTTPDLSMRPTTTTDLATSNLIDADVAADLVTDVAGVTALLAFEEFGVAEPIAAALASAGITTAFPIQALTLPIALDGHDVIGQARTGTGKTLAFGIPMLQHIAGTSRGRRAAPRGLVVVPTRELAIQVADDLRIAAGRGGTNVVT